MAVEQNENDAESSANIGQSLVAFTTRNGFCRLLYTHWKEFGSCSPSFFAVSDGPSERRFDQDAGANDEAECVKEVLPQMGNFEVTGHEQIRVCYGQLWVGSVVLQGTVGKQSKITI